MIASIAAGAAIYTVPQVQRLFHETPKEKVSRIGCEWSNAGFSQAWQQRDIDSLKNFMDGGFVIDRDIFFSILRDGDKEAPYYMYRDNDLIKLFDMPFKRHIEICSIPEEDIWNNSWLDKIVISDKKGKKFFEKICGGRGNFDDVFEYDRIYRNSLKARGEMPDPYFDSVIAKSEFLFKVLSPSGGV